MAAPESKTLKDLNGKWAMNKTLSHDTDPALKLQGISWLMRRALSLATITLHVTETEGAPLPLPDPTAAATTITETVTTITIVQTATGGLKGTTEKRCLDFAWREHTDYLFGHVRGRTRWITPADVAALPSDSAAHLARGWIVDDAREHVGPQSEGLIFTEVENLDDPNGSGGWTATQVWGFQVVDGQRRYCRNIVVRKGEDKYEFRLVYDWIE